MLESRAFHFPVCNYSLTGYGNGIFHSIQCYIFLLHGKRQSSETTADILRLHISNTKFCFLSLNYYYYPNISIAFRSILKSQLLFLFRFNLRFLSKKSLFQTKNDDVLMCRVHSFKDYVNIFFFFSISTIFLLDFDYPFPCSFMFYKLLSNPVHSTEPRIECVIFVTCFLKRQKMFQFNFVVNRLYR